MPWRCASCAYALAGLGERGTCPECGTVYERHRDGLTLFGYAAGQRGNVVNMRDGPFVRFAAIWTAFACYQIWQSAQRGRRTPFDLWWAAIPLYSLTLRAVTWFTAPEAGAVRLQLSRIGVRQVDIVPVAAAARRVFLACAALVAFGCLCWVLVELIFEDGVGVVLAVLILVGVGVSIVATAVVGRRIELIEKLRITFREGPSAAALAEPTHGWAKVDTVKLEPQSSGWHRLRVRRGGRLNGWDVVDAEVRLTDAEAEAVLAQLSRWRGCEHSEGSVP